MLTTNEPAARIVPNTHQHFAAKVLQSGAQFSITVWVDGRVAYEADTLPA